MGERERENTNKPLFFTRENSIQMISGYMQIFMSFKVRSNLRNAT